jgi:hypothetical protein
MLTESFGALLHLYQEILWGRDSFQSGPSQFIIYKHPPFRRLRSFYLLNFCGYFLFPLADLHITHTSRTCHWFPCCRLQGLSFVTPKTRTFCIQMASIAGWVCVHSRFILSLVSVLKLIVFSFFAGEAPTTAYDICRRDAADQIARNKPDLRQLGTIWESSCLKWNRIVAYSEGDFFLWLKILISCHFVLAR